MKTFEPMGVDTENVYIKLIKDGQSVIATVKQSLLTTDIYETNQETGEVTSTWIDEHFDALWQQHNPMAAKAQNAIIDTLIIDNLEMTMRLETS